MMFMRTMLSRCIMATLNLPPAGTGNADYIDTYNDGGAAFGSATGTVTEIGNGLYFLSTSAADINADDVVFRFTGTACDPVQIHIPTAS